MPGAKGGEGERLRVTAPPAAAHLPPVAASGICWAGPGPSPICDLPSAGRGLFSCWRMGIHAPPPPPPGLRCNYVTSPCAAVLCTCTCRLHATPALHSAVRHSAQCQQRHSACCAGPAAPAAPALPLPLRQRCWQAHPLSEQAPCGRPLPPAHPPVTVHSCVRHTPAGGHMPCTQQALGTRLRRSSSSCPCRRACAAPRGAAQILKGSSAPPGVAPASIESMAAMSMWSSCASCASSGVLTCGARQARG
jgi:hypothetical protein